MNIQSGVKGMILAAEGEAFNQENVMLVGGVTIVIMDEAHKSRNSVHPGADKMYYDLRDMLSIKGLRANYNNQRYLNGSGKASPWTSSQSYLEEGIGTI
ncbi:hypothetical protein Tco_0248949, partial [Tanacetum coccineum]